MRKRTAGLLLLALVMGWCLGWYTRDRWAPEARVSRMPARIVPPAPAGAPKSADDVAAARPQTSDAIRQLLQLKAYARAMERYEALQARSDAAAERARGDLLSYAAELIRQADCPAAVELLSLYLQNDYRDVDARLLIAEAYRGEKDLHTAIEQLYEAKAEAWRPEMLEQITRRIRALVTDYVDRLRQSGANDALLELYQDLTRLEPSYAPYFIGLASAQLALADSDAARQSLLLVAQDPEVGAQARELLDQVNVAAAEPARSETSAPASEVAGIPLVRSGNHFLVDARLGNAQPARLLIDTGASLTMLTPEALKHRGVTARETGRTGIFSTANGRVRAPIYRLDTLAVGDWQVSNLDVGVLELDNPQFDGLLGMNFLRHFQFFIDQNEALLRLSIAAQTD